IIGYFEGCSRLKTFRKITLLRNEYWLGEGPRFQDRHGKPLAMGRQDHSICTRIQGVLGVSKNRTDKFNIFIKAVLPDNFTQFTQMAPLVPSRNYELPTRCVYGKFLLEKRPSDQGLGDALFRMQPTDIQ